MLKRLRAKSRKNQKGFTLIELLAVIVILAILAAIAIPSVISIINKQNDKAEVQDALTAIQAAKVYVADNNSAFAADNTISLTAAQLSDYLDQNSSSIKDKSFTVKVTKSVSSSVTSYSYSISDVTLPGNKTSATETDLINFNKNGTSLP